MYDVTNEQSFKNLKGWLEKLREYSDPNIKIALVANKKDLVEGPDPRNIRSNKILFKELIEENEKDDQGSQPMLVTKKTNKIKPNFRIEAFQYEGGSKDQ